MNFREYGTDKPNKIMLLHGGGLSWWNYRREAEFLQRDYHVILPILDGHAESDRPFTTIEDNAAEIIDFIDSSLGGMVLLIGGLSLGGQILLEMLSQRKDVCRYALVESAMVLPSRLTHALIGPVFGSSLGLMRNKSFAHLQFRSLHMEDSLFDDYYRDTCKIAASDMIAFLKASTAYSMKASMAGCTAALHLFAGAKEVKGIKKSMTALHHALPASSATILPGLYHGEFSLNHPQEYVNALRTIIGEQPAPLSSGVKEETP